MKIDGDIQQRTRQKKKSNRDEISTREMVGWSWVAKEAITRVEVMDGSGRLAPGETIPKFESGDAGAETNPQEIVRVRRE